MNMVTSSKHKHSESLYLLKFSSKLGPKPQIATVWELVGDFRNKG